MLSDGNKRRMYDASLSYEWDGGGEAEGTLTRRLGLGGAIHFFFNAEVKSDFGDPRREAARRDKAAAAAAEAGKQEEEASAAGTGSGETLVTGGALPPTAGTGVTPSRI